MILGLLLLIQLKLEMILLDVIRLLPFFLLMWFLQLQVMLSLGNGLWYNIASISYVGKGWLGVLQVAFCSDCVNFSIILVSSARLLLELVWVQELVNRHISIEVHAEVSNLTRRQRVQML